MSTSILSVRVNPEEKALLEAAAEEERTSLSEFVRRRSVQAAETALFHRNLVTIPAEDWEAFEAWMAQPPQDNPRLVALAGRKPKWGN